MQQHQQQQLARNFLRHLLARRLPARPASDKRLFTRNRSLALDGRPQLPFLSVPLARNQQFRYLTTERKRWLKHELLLSVKYTAYIWAIVGCGLVAYWSVQQEWLERMYPTPHEWGFITRMRFRQARWAADQTLADHQTDWAAAGLYARDVLKRLEDPGIEGAGVEIIRKETMRSQPIPGLPEEDLEVEFNLCDVTAKEESWQRGYYEALSLCAKASERLDDYVHDKTRDHYCPAEMVRSPVNPHPKPIPHGAPSAPRYQDCGRAYEDPEIYYSKIMETRGFTPKQRMDAMLEYSNWLDMKGRNDPQITQLLGKSSAEFALDLAVRSGIEGTLLDAIPPFDPVTYVLRDGPARPSANLLTALTAMGAYKARHGDLAAALPILISVLRVRRTLPGPEEGEGKSGSGTGRSPPVWTAENLLGFARRIAFQPAYPPPPDDGLLPPVRDAKERCEEASLNMYIGEIIYASGAKGSSSRDDGLAWTREAVDLAEEQLHKLSSAPAPTPSEKLLLGTPQRAEQDKIAKQTCKECLGAGLENWATMVGRLAREERERTAGKASGSGGGGGSWFGFWGRPPVEQEGRWAAEEAVVKERTKRVQELLEDHEEPTTGPWSLFKA